MKTKINYNVIHSNQYLFTKNQIKTKIITLNCEIMNPICQILTKLIIKY